MNHSITVGGLLLTLGLIAGLLTVCIGALATFAGGMSDDPTAGADASRTGCFIFIAGALLFGASLWGLLS